MLDKSAVFNVILKTTRPNFYVNIEKFNLFHGLLDHLSIRYWVAAPANLFIFNSKAGNVLAATGSTFLP